MQNKLGVSSFCGWMLRFMRLLLPENQAELAVTESNGSG
jgi:hypothetical protein